MSQQRSKQDNDSYVLGYGDASVNWMAARKASTHAAFFLPFLTSGMRLLDCGCGPGTITVDLASMVAPEMMQAIDIEAPQVEITRQRAQDLGLENLEVNQGSILDLPFEASSFDAVFISAVIGNISDAETALAEAYRVLKPNGLLGIREFDHSGNLVHPMTDVMCRSIQVYEDVRAHSGCSRNFGRQLRGSLQKTGFEIEYINALYENFGEKAAVKAHGEGIKGLFEQDLGRQALSLGFATEDELKAIIECWQNWGDDPESFFAAAWVEAVARKV